MNKGFAITFFGRRVISMIIDYFSMGFICAILAMPFFITIPEGTLEHINLFNRFWFFVALCGFALFFVKDYNGRSFGKRAVNLIVSDVKTGFVASPLKCLIRNLSFILWPVDIIVFLLTHNRRLGDFIAGTVVVSYDPYSPLSTKKNGRQNILSFLIAIVLIYLFTMPFQC
jgi:uncharacterized RDD family membrane protein YckC